MFTITFSNVLLTLCYMLPAYLLCKCKKAVADHLPTLSAILVFFCSPCLITNSFLSIKPTPEILLEMGLFFVVTLTLQVAFIGGMYLFLRKRYDDARVRILNVGCIMGNVGFFGLPVISAMLPNNPEVACFSAIFSISMNIISYTMCVFCLTRDKKYMTPRAAILNPSVLALCVAFPLMLLEAGSFLPTVALSAINLLGRMTTPLCMIILGIRLATVPLRVLVTNKMVYLVSACKLVVFPLFAYGVVYFLPLSAAFKASILVLCATPCASMLLNLAELHRSETKFCANCVLLSTLLSIVTLPVLSLLL